MKLKAIVYGKKNCSLCENRKENLRRFPAAFKKKTGKEVQLEIEYHDIKTVEGLVAFCQDDRFNSEIPVVILEDDKGRFLHAWQGPEDVLTSRRLAEAVKSLL